MANVNFKTKQEIEAERLVNWREFAQVSAFQARAALNSAGLRDQVETLMNDPNTDQTVKDAWEYATTFKRNSPTVLALANDLGLTDEQLDDLFTQAKDIEA
ncbi:MAG: hypothetical protein CMF22_10595 [Idiomarinaceae bacterium]|nr:hypothetical protein [Idiomarinaceae bacterium]MBG23889.1 hypothetical protein [Idiomarinaceae bacterium]|tara:strand:+ start:11802 stop:12104 length:303 start_codon:yes stop_codon:yes gene_type:complete